MPIVKSTVTTVVTLSNVQQQCVALSGPKPASRILPANLSDELTSLANVLLNNVDGPRRVVLVIMVAP